MAIKNNIFYIFYSNPRSFLLEKVTDLETLLKKRCGSVLPPTHQVMLDLKLELANLYDCDRKLDNLNKRLEILGEQIKLIENLEGSDTDSRMKGFLQYRIHNLLIAKVADLQRKKALNEKDVKEIGTQLHISLSESARICKKNAQDFHYLDKKPLTYYTS